MLGRKLKFTSRKYTKCSKFSESFNIWWMILTDK